MGAIDNAHDIEAFALSPTHARGLRRDLFRMLEARVARVPTFEQCWNLLRLPYRSARDANAVFLRTKNALRACSSDFIGRERTCDALLLLPATRAHEAGPGEPVLDVRSIHLEMRDRRPQGSIRTIGTVSHHAVERMFQRLGTTSKEDVLAEMLAFSLWARLLQILAIAATTGPRIEQLPLPTPRGIFLCVRETETWEVHMRTWIAHGMSPRYDASVASIMAFCRTLTGGPVGDTLARFDAMAQCPENRWWRTPHPDAVRACTRA